MKGKTFLVGYINFKSIKLNNNKYKSKNNRNGRGINVH